MYMLRVFILNTHKTSISALISPGIYFLIWLFLLRVYLLITAKSHLNFPSCYVLTSSTALIIKLKSTTYSLITFSAYWVNVQWPYLEGLAGKCNTLLTILSSLSITNIHTTWTTIVIMSIITTRCSSYIYQEYLSIWGHMLGRLDSGTIKWQGWYIRNSKINKVHLRAQFGWTVGGSRTFVS